MARRGQRGVFQRVLELVLDRKTARETQQRAQDAIRKGTDPAAAKRNLGVVGNAMHDLRTIAIRVGFALAAIFSVRFAKRMFELGTAVEETGAKFRTVFGPAANAVEAELKEFANTAGLTVQQAQDLTGTMGAIAQSMGMAQAESGQFSTRLLRISADIASFNNVAGGAEQVMGAFQSAMTGQFMPLRQYGIMLSVADINTRALLETGKERVEQLTQEERAQATLNLAVERAGVQIGDLERTKLSAANTARRLNARYRELQDQLAAELLPTFALMLGAVDDNEGAFNALQRAIAAVFRTIRTLTGGIAILGADLAVLEGHVRVLWARMTRGDVDAARRSLEHVRTAAEEIRMEIVGATGAAEELAATGAMIQDAMEGAVEATKNMADEMRRAEQERISLLRSALQLNIATRDEKEEVLFRIRQANDALRAGNVALEERVRLTTMVKDLSQSIGLEDPALRRISVGQLASPEGPSEMDQLLRAGLPFGRVGPSDREQLEQVEEFVRVWHDANADLLMVAERTGFGIMNAFKGAFEAIAVEGQGIGGMMEALFRGIGGAALGALADLASSKVAENIAFAAENFAKSLGWIAMGNVASAGAAKAAAGQHLKAAGMWAVLGGGAAAGQSAVGGQSGGIPSGARDPAGRMADGLDRIGPDIIIRVDGVDPKSPRHQELVGKTAREYQQRFGGRIRVEG